MKGVARMATGPKEAPPDTKPVASPEDAALSEAYEAMRDGDKAGFLSSMKTAFAACMDDYESSKEDEDEEV